MLDERYARVIFFSIVRGGSNNAMSWQKFDTYESYDGRSCLAIRVRHGEPSAGLHLQFWLTNGYAPFAPHFVDHVSDLKRLPFADVELVHTSWVWEGLHHGLGLVDESGAKAHDEIGTMTRYSLCL